MTKDALKASIPAREEIYVLYSGVTHVPYVECDEKTFDDEIFVYTDKEACVKRAKELQAENRPAVCVIVKKEISLQFFSELFLYGINALIIMDGEDRFSFQLSEIVKRKIPDSAPDGSRPLENPQLQLSMLYYMQELRRKAEDGESPNRQAMLKEMDEEMVANLVRATYLLPVKESDKEGEPHMQLLFIRLKDATPMLPLFTDAMEYRKFGGKDDFKLVMTDVEKLAEITMPPESKGFLVNPGGVALPLPVPYMQKLAAMRKGRPVS